MAITVSRSYFAPIGYTSSAPESYVQLCFLSPILSAKLTAHIMERRMFNELQIPLLDASVQPEFTCSRGSTQHLQLRLCIAGTDVGSDSHFPGVTEHIDVQKILSVSYTDRPVELVVHGHTTKIRIVLHPWTSQLNVSNLGIEREGIVVDPLHYKGGLHQGLSGDAAA